MKNIDQIAIKAITDQLAELIDACMDGDQVIAPSKKVLMASRAALPPTYEKSLIKKRPNENKAG